MPSSVVSTVVPSSRPALATVAPFVAATVAETVGVPTTTEPVEFGLTLLTDEFDTNVSDRNLIVVELKQLVSFTAGASTSLSTNVISTH
jgi:hypothetical protein